MPAVANTRKLVGLFSGPALALVMLAIGAPENLSPEAWRTAAVGALMAVWWMTEAIPIPATALLPLAVFPLLGIGSIDDAARPYAHPLIFLFMGGFLIALAMERWRLHRRIALYTIRAIGVQPGSIIFGMMVACAFLSMWVSNTATTMMMLPIGISVIGLVIDTEEGETSADGQNFAVVLMLGIAYAASIGGLGTIIGTPPNAFLAGYFSEAHGIEIGFGQWMTVGIPLVLITLPIAFFLLRTVFPTRLKELPGGRELIEGELREMGPMSQPERRVATVFVLVAILWITRPLLDDYVPGLSDAGIAMVGALALFLTPAETENGTFLLNWSKASELPWGVLILFGGGLSLAAAIESTGLATWIGEGFSRISQWPTLLILATVATTIVFLTELTSNTATATAFVPIMGSVAVGIGEHPMLLAAPAALAASCAFMLPVATPPNAIVYGSGKLSIPQMARAGVGLNILAILIITLTSYTALLWTFGIEIGTLPTWATS